MFTLALCLTSNLTMLALVMAGCHLFNRRQRHLTIHGPAIFVMLQVAAAIFDFVLTYTVFVDSQNHYRAFSTTDAFVQRASAYVLACAIALGWARVRRHRADATHIRATANRRSFALRHAACRICRCDPHKSSHLFTKNSSLTPRCTTSSDREYALLMRTRSAITPED